jgi:hypothetical protein
VTVKTAASAKVVGTFSGAYYGEVASITASLVGGDIIPTANTGDIDDFIFLEVKDANGKGYGLAEVNALTIDGTGLAAGATTTATFVMADGTTAATKNRFQADDALCPATSAGKSATVQARITNATGTKILSNTLTLKCGAAEGAVLTVDRVEYSKSNPAPGETFLVYVYMENADGVLGGATETDTADFTLNLSGATVATDSATNWITSGTVIDVSTLALNGYGRYELYIKAPATVGATIAVSDPASSILAKVYTTNDAYEGVLSVGPKKLKATADFGPAAAKKKVAFVLENAAGVTKTYYRRANASGVATYTLALRGTWTVYATFGDEISDTGTMRR